ncbi:MAG: hypothetical protein GQ558_05785 [Thermoplasmata archaeon]|nr:hypothetical protein [Thermoplasmata archaeon]
MACDLITIQISMMTRDRLKQLGRKGETLDQVVNRLIGMAKKNEWFE